MVTVQLSSARRSRLVRSGWLTLLALAGLIAACLLSSRLVYGEASDPPTVMIEIEHGDHCHVVPSSCSGATTVTSAWSAGPQPMIILQALLLREASSADVHVPPGAFVLLPAPPPRAA